MMYSRFSAAIKAVESSMVNHAYPIHTDKWQAIDIKDRPEAEMREILYVEFRVPMPGFDLDEYRKEIQPNLPWADDHFELERVSGHPYNPGTTWKEWPYGLAADKHRTEGEQFSHSYAERYWPKYAGRTPGDRLNSGIRSLAHFGIRYRYGDLDDVVNLLVNDPYTRQAYLPVWFPEDTGAHHGQRVPCTLGYHFMRRGNNFHVYYPIRSCDFVRHFRDDLYLTIRLLLWILEQLKTRSSDSWLPVVPGMFMFWAGSMHCFVNDWRKLKSQYSSPAG